uniref:Uncharacterized protein n=1 Tax=viral metagenome TaxID=1070528 RepID=A0A6M3L3I0_9ZZZZ
MAENRILSVLLKKGRLKRETERKKRYLQHYEKAGPEHAMTYAQWKKEGEQPTYFKGAGLRKTSVESQLREAGVSPSRFKKKKQKK